MKKTLFIVYTWATTLLFAAVIYWIATLPYFRYGNTTTDDLMRVIYKMVEYAILFILIYRSIMLTLKSTVVRLAHYRSKGEKGDDEEFVLIIETLIIIITTLSCILFSIFETYVSGFVAGRTAEIKDVLISTMAILLTGIVLYTIPVIGEFEMAIKHKIESEVKLYKDNRKK